jgi:outer membrane protein TolC
MAARRGSGPRPALGELQGVIITQEIPTANKKQISRRKFEWEVEAARWLRCVQELKILNDVRIHFFEVLAAQELAEIRVQLLKIADASLRTTEEMANQGQTNVPDLLQAQVRRQQARVLLTAAENAHRKAWISLVATTGLNDLPPARLVGPLDADAPVLDPGATLARILDGSPEIKAAQMEVRRNEVTVLRERVQPIPNMYFQGMFGYNGLDGGPGINLQLTINPPVWHKNQGNIYQAQTDLMRGRERVRLLALDLQKRLAGELATYHTALDITRTFRDESIPRARRGYELLLEAYKRRRGPGAPVVVGQRGWFQFRSEYVLALLELRKSEVEINGFLVVGGLNEPPVPDPLSNLNVTVHPR